MSVSAFERLRRTFVFHLSNRNISQNSSIVDLWSVSTRTAFTSVSIYQNIDATKVLDRCVDDLVAILYSFVVCNCDSPGFLDFFNDLIGDF